MTKFYLMSGGGEGEFLALRANVEFIDRTDYVRKINEIADGFEGDGSVYIVEPNDTIRFDIKNIFGRKGIHSPDFDDPERALEVYEANRDRMPKIVITGLSYDETTYGFDLILKMNKIDDEELDAAVRRH